METGLVEEIKREAALFRVGKESVVPWKRILDSAGVDNIDETLKDIEDSQSCFCCLYVDDGVDCAGAPGEEPCADFKLCGKIYEAVKLSLTKEEASPESAPIPASVPEATELSEAGRIEAVLDKLAELFPFALEVKVISPRMSKVFLDFSEIATITQRGMKLKGVSEPLSIGLPDEVCSLKHRQLFVETLGMEQGRVEDFLFKFLQVASSSPEAPSCEVDCDAAAEEAPATVAAVYYSQPEEDFGMSITSLERLLKSLGIHSVQNNGQGYIFLKKVVEVEA